MIGINQNILKTVLYLMWIIFVEGQRNNYNIVGSQPPPPPPPIKYDNLGNCYVDAIRLRGHCVRYGQCLSAVQNWQYYQRIPFSCYYNAYDNYVCCPEAYVTSASIRPTPPPPPIYHPPSANPFLPRISTNPLTQEQRLSELECSAVYNQPLERNRHHHHHHRSRRSMNNTNIDESTNKEIFESPVQEEIITKEEVQETEVVGGRATYRNEFPYMCALGWRKSSKRGDTSYSCGCVLIARRYVLTAAHCATLGGESPSVVRLGGVNLDERRAEVIKIQRITQHPEYDSRLAYNDIAVIKLEKNSRQIPACVWPNEGLPQQQLIALGYGQTKFAGPSTNNLLKVYLNVLTNENCNLQYKPNDKLINGVDAGQICAGDPQGEMDTCQGDSGGPLLISVFKYNTNVPYIVGLTSFGEGCASGVPSIYSRVSHFIEWIETVVWK